MIIDDQSVQDLLSRIHELEDKVESLRISRRVLMNLLDNLEKEKQQQMTQLRTENEKLQHRNSQYAHVVMRNHIRIAHLENKLDTLGYLNHTYRQVEL